MNIQNKQQWKEAFIEACEEGKLKEVRHLCEKQYLDLGWADIHINDEEGFRSACYSGHLELVKYLLTSPELIEAGHSFAHLHEKNDEGFRWACRQGQLDVVKYLLTSPELKEASHTFSNLHARNDEGFRMACRNEHLDVVKYLLTSPELIEAGHTWADAHALRDQSVLLACAYNYWNVVRWLVMDYGIEKTMEIEEIAQEYPQVQEYFRSREELQAIQEALHHYKPRNNEPSHEKTDFKSFKKSKKL